MRVVVIIQARLGSTRLPGKVMMMLSGKTVLEHVITRVKACSKVDDVVIATTSNHRGDVIVKEAARCQVKWYRGSEEDVLARYYEAAREFEANIIVRVTSDCPLFDPLLLGEMIANYSTWAAEGRAPDYFSNTVRRTYPRGLDIEIFTFEALEKAMTEASQLYEREHVTPYFYENQELFTIDQHVGTEDQSDLRWTLDTPEDMKLIQCIYDALFFDGKIFTTSDVLAFLQENPRITNINAGIMQKELGELP